MPNYRNARLYTIRSHHTDKIYIGSTCNKLPHRLHMHRGKYKAFKEGKFHYVSSFEIIQYPDHYIELLKYAPCNSKAELLQLEGNEIRAADNCVNMRVAGRTKKEYYEENKEHMDEYYKQWREDNKEDLKKKKKIYYEENKEDLNEKHKQYYEENKEVGKQRAKKNYYEKKDIRGCLCGASYNYGDKTRRNKHYGSKTHKKYILDFYTRLNEQLTE